MRPNLVFVLLLTQAAYAQPFSVTVPGQAIEDNGAVSVIPITVPPAFQQMNILELEITGLSHTNPDDLDMFLISPLGVIAEIMTDRGGSIPAVNLTMAFSDTASVVPPDDGPLSPGSYRPEGLHQGTDGGLASTGTSSPTGDAWLVLVIDDAVGNTGIIESVTLRGEGAPAAVPALSEWGLAVLTLAGLVAGTILFRPVQTSEPALQSQT